MNIDHKDNEKILLYKSSVAPIELYSKDEKYFIYRTNNGKESVPLAIGNVDSIILNIIKEEELKYRAIEKRKKDGFV